MAATPFEHDAEALATKWTEVPEVLPLVGELTETPAKEGRAKADNRHTKNKHLPECIYISQLIFFVKKPRQAANSFFKKPRQAAKLEVNSRKASTYTQRKTPVEKLEGTRAKTLMTRGGHMAVNIPPIATSADGLFSTRR